MRETVLLIGGAYDGDTVTLSRPLDVLLLPDLTATSVLLPTDLTDRPLGTVLTYRPIIGPLGYPSRADDGSLRYQLAA